MSGADDVSGRPTTRPIAGVRTAILLIVVAIIMFFGGWGLSIYADEFGWRVVGVVIAPVAIAPAAWGGRALRIHRERSAQTSSPHEGGR